MMRSAAQSATMISTMWLKGVMLKILENSNFSIIKDDSKQFKNIPRGDYAYTTCMQGTGGSVEFTDRRKAIFQQQYYRVKLVK